MDKQTARLFMAMVEYDKGDARRIQHFTKVHGFAMTIARLEDIPPEESAILEVAAILHDIGIRNSEEKYHSRDGKFQEQEGPPEAEKLLRRLGGYTDAQIERVKYLIGHHHTYTSIDGIDYQILVEADFLVNIYEDEMDAAQIRAIRKRIFKTQAGLKMLDDMFGVKYEA